MIEGSSWQEIDWQQCLESSLSGVISLLFSYELNEKFAKKVAKGIYEIIEWFEQIFEDFSVDSKFTKEVIEKITSFLLAELPLRLLV
ncbi:MAG: hypothetical protein IJX07_04530 [Bacillales bacterium]|nr:hypothetical protein [Bacillales bacterium]